MKKNYTKNVLSRDGNYLSTRILFVYCTYTVGLLCRSVMFTISRRSIMHVVIRVSGYSRSFRNDKFVCVCVSVCTQSIWDRNSFFNCFLL